MLAGSALSEEASGTADTREGGDETGGGNRADEAERGGIRIAGFGILKKERNSYY